MSFVSCASVIEFECGECIACRLHQMVKRMEDELHNEEVLREAIAKKGGFPSAPNFDCQCKVCEREEVQHITIHDIPETAGTTTTTARTTRTTTTITSTAIRNSVRRIYEFLSQNPMKLVIIFNIITIIFVMHRVSI